MPHAKREPRDLLTVLLVSDGEPEADALKRRLRLLGLGVDESAAADTARTAFITAPDLVVIAGHAAADGGLAILEAMGAHHATQVTPVVVIGRGDGSPHAGRAALRHGVVAIVDRAEGVEVVARRVLGVARDLARRPGQVSGALDEVRVDELVALLRESRRAGMLAVRDAQNAVLAHLVVRGDRPVEEMIAELLARIRGVGAEGRGPLRYDFVESSSASLRQVVARPDADVRRVLDGRRLALVERDAGRAIRFATALRSGGAHVSVIEAGGAGLDEARRALPSVILVDAESLEGWAADVIQEVTVDPLLGWASILIVEHARLVDGDAVRVDRLAAGVLELLEPDRELGDRVRAEARFDARLEVVGPARSLRAVARSGEAARVSAHHPRVRVELTLADGRVHSARATARGRRERLDGAAALGSLLHLPTARLHIERLGAPPTGAGEPLDEALAAAAALPAFVQHERAAPRPPTEPPSPPDGSQVARLVQRLESLLGVDDGIDERTERVEGLADVVADAPLPEASGERETRRLAPPQIDMEEPTGRLVARGAALPLDTNVDGSDDLDLADSTELDVEDSTEVLLGGIDLDAEDSTEVVAPASAASLGSEDSTEVVAPASLASLDAEDATEVVAGPAAPRVRGGDPLVEEPEDEPTAQYTGDRMHALLPPFMPALHEVDEPETMRDLPDPLEDDGDEATTAHRAPAPSERPAPTTLPRIEPEGEGEPTLLEDWPREPGAPGGPPEPPLWVDPPVVSPPAAPRGATAATAAETARYPRSAEAPRSRRRLTLAAVAIGGLAFVAGVGGAVLFLWPSSPPPPSGGDSIAARPGADEPGADEPGADEPGADGREPAGEPRAAEAEDAGAPTATDAGPGPDPDAGPADAGPGPDAGPGADAGSGEATAEATSEPPASPVDGALVTDPLEGHARDDELTALGITPEEGGRARAARVRTLIRRGAAARRGRRWERAERAYRGALSIDPRNGPAMVGLVHVYRGLEDGRRAVLFAQLLTRLRPREASSYLLLSDAFVTAGETDAARRAAERALTLDRSSRAARRRLQALDGE